VLTLHRSVAKNRSQASIAALEVKDALGFNLYRRPQMRDYGFQTLLISQQPRSLNADGQRPHRVTFWYGEYCLVIQFNDLIAAELPLG
jgi:hypothetical protein